MRCLRHDTLFLLRLSSLPPHMPPNRVVSVYEPLQLSAIVRLLFTKLIFFLYISKERRKKTHFYCKMLARLSHKVERERKWGVGVNCEADMQSGD